ncbi:putative phosphatidate phosphatase [Drosophila erecta]|uniref:Phosphatidic acid phosphatase type 2/haloperoxidase domain-containing protein n=1 Tax=Drosophila erecta TaxID=7220 RepID=B3N7G9_DROER|nr:putative phosphatidate phosphatase [Drosophila erecta]EDV59374.1 uncharacterized protein Dere_GG23436 [Drosophila erecta]
MSSLRPVSVSDTTPLQRFESQSSSGEEPSSPTASSIVAADSNQTPNHNNNNVKLDLQLPNFVGSSRSQGPLYAVPSNNKSPLRGPRKILGRILMDLCLLSCVGLPMLGFSLWGEAVNRGFFCNDSSLKHPYRDSSMPSWILYLMCGALPLSVMLVVEFFRGQDKRLHSPFQKNTVGSGYQLCHLELPTWLVECYHRMGIFIFGLGVEQLSTNIAKYSIGRLRPHFYTLCQPVMKNGTTCSDPINAARYIEDFTCAAVDITSKQLKDMRLSFPSGHASFACYSMLYLVIYLHRRMHWKQMRMLCHLLQFLLLMFAWYTALTRVSDYKHHWSDVLAGSGIGLTYAVIVTSTMW